MSVIFGLCEFRGALVDEQSLRELGLLTTRYGPDGTTTYTNGRVGMGVQAFVTSRRATFIHKPYVDCAGNMVALDGRIDNYIDIAMAIGASERLADTELVLGAFRKWRAEAFSRLVGDWAIALWSASDDTLYLARDHAGSRNLLYSHTAGAAKWSSCLETFFHGDLAPQINDEYVTRAICYQENHGLSPYSGIDVVPPAHYVVLKQGRAAIRPHWYPASTSRTKYPDDAQYDDEFLHLLGVSLERRVDSNGIGALAELSGGVDSSSLVCLADRVLQQVRCLSERVETVSYFDDTEATWDERPYFTAVESHRGRIGIHIDCSGRHPSYQPLSLNDRIYPYPDGDNVSLQIADEFEKAIEARPYRVLISGIGGDELLGGVPTGLPELADHLRQARVGPLLAQSAKWALSARRPLIHLLWETLTFAGKCYTTPRHNLDALPPWLREPHRQACTEPRLYPVETVTSLNNLPSSISDARSWWELVDNLPHRYPSLGACREYRYPYLDRDLVDFLHRVPRDQLVRPGRRRLLMRRALKGIVPEVVLERKRKAYVSRGPLNHLRASRWRIEALFKESLLAAHGLIDDRKFLETLQTELMGDLKWIGHLGRTINLELWLQRMERQQFAAKIASV